MKEGEGLGLDGEPSCELIVQPAAGSLQTWEKIIYDIATRLWQDINVAKDPIFISFKSFYIL